MRNLTLVVVISFDLQLQCLSGFPHQTLQKKKQRKTAIYFLRINMMVLISDSNLWTDRLGGVISMSAI